VAQERTAIASLLTRLAYEHIQEQPNSALEENIAFESESLANMLKSLEMFC